MTTTTQTMTHDDIFSAARVAAERIWRAETGFAGGLLRDLDSGPWCLQSVPIPDDAAGRVIEALRAGGVHHVEIRIWVDPSRPGATGRSTIWLDLDPDRRERERLASILASRAEREVREQAEPGEIVTARAESAAQTVWHRAMAAPIAELRREVAELEPPPGFEERAVERAHAAGLFDRPVEIRNLTPHPITIIRRCPDPHGPPEAILERRTEYPACAPADLPRAVEALAAPLSDPALMRTGLIEHVGYVGVTGLPEYTLGRYWIVSIVTAIGALAARRTADDLLVPTGQVRDAQGRVIGATGLAPAKGLLRPMALACGAAL